MKVKIFLVTEMEVDVDVPFSREDLDNASGFEKVYKMDEELGDAVYKSTSKFEKKLSELGEVFFCDIEDWAI